MCKKKSRNIFFHILCSSDIHVCNDLLQQVGAAQLCLGSTLQGHIPLRNTSCTSLSPKKFTNLIKDEQVQVPLKTACSGPEELL